MSKKISEMTPTGVAPATSELALAYNGENYKITPQNLVDSTSSGGGGAFTSGSVFRVEDKGFMDVNAPMQSPHAHLQIQPDGSAAVAGVPVSPDLKYSVLGLEFTKWSNYLNAANNGSVVGGGPGYLGSLNYNYDNLSNNSHDANPKFWIHSGLIPTYHRASNMNKGWSQRGVEFTYGVYALIYDNQLYFAQQWYIADAPGGQDYYISYGNYTVAVTN